MDCPFCDCLETVPKIACPKCKREWFAADEEEPQKEEQYPMIVNIEREQERRFQKGDANFYVYVEVLTYADDSVISTEVSQRVKSL